MSRKLFLRYSFALLTALGLLSLGLIAFAQDGKPAPEPNASINVIVTDRSDRAVEDVHPEDLQVLDDGVAQTISHFARDDRPIACGFVIDASGSVRRILANLIDSAKVVAGSMRAGDEGFVMRFVGRDNIRIKLEMTADSEAIADVLDDIYVEGGQTALYDAVDQAVNYLEENSRGDVKSRRPVLVLITDGEDRASKIKDSQAVVARLRQSNIQVFVLGLTRFSALQSSQSRATAFLNNVAEQTGGRAFFPESDSGLPEAAQELARTLRTQFVVGYSTNKSAGEHHIQARWIGRSEPGKRKAITRPVVAAK